MTAATCSSQKSTEPNRPGANGITPGVTTVGEWRASVTSKISASAANSPVILTRSQETTHAPFLCRHAVRPLGSAVCMRLAISPENALNPKVGVPILEAPSASARASQLGHSLSATAQESAGTSGVRPWGWTDWSI